MKDNIINIKNVSFTYDVNKAPAVDGVSLDIKNGETICILGHNGSGKSTLGKLINGLLLPDKGNVFVMGKDTKGDELWAICQSVGMIFQNPDDQLVASLADEDIAFGLENIGLPQKDMDERIDDALGAVGMTKFKHSLIDGLSGGQKQKIAIAGILALRPECIIMDEATAMLDPKGRRDVCNIVFRLREEYGLTVVMITHFIEEAALCDKIYVMEKGRIVLGGDREDVLLNISGLKELGLKPPFYTDIGARLGFGAKIYTCEGLGDEIAALVSQYNSNITIDKNELKKTPDNILEIRDLYYAYGKEPVLKGLDFDIKEGSFTSVIGHTGSGKSTLMRTLNGLYKPLKGNVYFRGKEVGTSADIRRKVALVFQNADHQLFEETVIKDVMFGALNMGLSEAEARREAALALKAVGFPEEKYESSPFELSGGEKKRAAIAGILVLKPEVLVLDEPGAGLDIAGRKDIADCINNIRLERGLTVISVTHSMEDAAEYSDNIIVLNRGRVYKQGTPEEIFEDYEDLQRVELDVPEVVRLKKYLELKGISLPKEVLTADGLVNSLVKRMS